MALLIMSADFNIVACIKFRPHKTLSYLLTLDLVLHQLNQYISLKT